MKKLWILVLTFIIFTFSLLLVSCKKDEDKKDTNGNLEFTYSSFFDTYFLVGIGDCKDDHIIVPSYHKGKPVTCAYLNDFGDCSTLKSITFPETLETIYGWFNTCPSLVNVYFPDKSIGLVSVDFSTTPSLKFNEYDNAYYLGSKQNPFVCLAKPKSDSVSLIKLNKDIKFWNSSAFDEDIFLCNEATTPSGWEYNSSNIYWYSEEAPKFLDDYWHYDSSGEIALWDNSSIIGEMVQIDNFEYSLDEETMTATVIRYLDTTVAEKIFIPSTITYNEREYTVTTLGKNLFKDLKLHMQSSSVEVKIPATIRVIRKNAFYNCTDVRITAVLDNSENLNEWVDSLTVAWGNYQVTDVLKDLRPAIGWSKYD